MSNIFVRIVNLVGEIKCIKITTSCSTAANKYFFALTSVTVMIPWWLLVTVPV